MAVAFPEIVTAALVDLRQGDLSGLAAADRLAVHICWAEDSVRRIKAA